jgi:hypothetical protein
MAIALTVAGGECCILPLDLFPQLTHDLTPPSTNFLHCGHYFA